MDEVQTLDKTNERKHSKMDIPQFIEPGKLGGWLLEGESIEDGMDAIKCRKIWVRYEKGNGAPDYYQGKTKEFFRNMELRSTNHRTGNRLEDFVPKMAMREQPIMFKDIPIVWDNLTVVDCANCGSNLIEFWQASKGGNTQIQQKMRCCSEMELAPAEVIPIQPIFER